MKLYHGTSSVKLENIQAMGFLVEPYLTISWELAEYYAEVCTDETGGHGIVLEFEVPDEKNYLLQADQRAFEEPISFVRSRFADTEEAWHEMINNGDIQIPRLSDWESSLQYTDSVRMFKNLKMSECLNIEKTGYEISSDKVA